MSRIFEFIANSGDGVFAVDHLQTIVLWNERAVEILGFSAAEVLGKKCYRIVCGRDAQGCAVCRRDCEAIAAAQSLRPAATADVIARSKGDAEIWLNLSTVVVPSRRGKLSVLVHLFRDVTQGRGVLRIARKLADMVADGSSEEPRLRPPTVPDDACRVDLTRREREILSLLASCSSTEAIAGKLHISKRTVCNHVNNILRKLDVHSRLEAVTYAIRHGLV